MTLTLETENLPPEVAAKIEGPVAQAGFFGLMPEALKPKGSGTPDVLTCRLSIATPGRSHTVVVNDITAPQSLRPLLEILQEIAWDQRRQGK